jgi:hypothetical protein
MSNNTVDIEITETRTHQITVDLDKYCENVKKAYEEGDANFFGDWVNSADNTEITYEWG